MTEETSPTSVQYEPADSLRLVNVAVRVLAQLPEQPDPGQTIAELHTIVATRLASMSGTPLERFDPLVTQTLERLLHEMPQLPDGLDQQTKVVVGINYVASVLATVSGQEIDLTNYETIEEAVRFGRAVQDWVKVHGNAAPIQGLGLEALFIPTEEPLASRAQLPVDQTLDDTDPNPPGEAEETPSNRLTRRLQLVDYIITNCQPGQLIDRHTASQVLGLAPSYISHLLGQLSHQGLAVSSRRVGTHVTEKQFASLQKMLGIQPTPSEATETPSSPDSTGTPTWEQFGIGTEVLFDFSKKEFLEATNTILKRPLVRIRIQGEKGVYTGRFPAYHQDKPQEQELIGATLDRLNIGTTTLNELFTLLESTEALNEKPSLWDVLLTLETIRTPEAEAYKTSIKLGILQILYGDTEPADKVRIKATTYSVQKIKAMFEQRLSR